MDHIGKLNKDLAALEYKNIDVPHVGRFDLVFASWFLMIRDGDSSQQVHEKLSKCDYFKASALAAGVKESDLLTCTDLIDHVGTEAFAKKPQNEKISFVKQFIEKNQKQKETNQEVKAQQTITSIYSSASQITVVPTKNELSNSNVFPSYTNYLVSMFNQHRQFSPESENKLRLYLSKLASGRH